MTKHLMKRPETKWVTLTGDYKKDNLFTNSLLDDIPHKRKTTMKLVIIESPYAGDIQLNTEYARACVHDSLSQDEAPIASHLLYTQPGILDDNTPEERKQGIEAGLAWHKVADLIVIYTDYGISKGMASAIEGAITSGIDIEYRKIE